MYKHIWPPFSNIINIALLFRTVAHASPRRIAHSSDIRLSHCGGDKLKRNKTKSGAEIVYMTYYCST